MLRRASTVLLTAVLAGSVAGPATTAAATPRITAPVAVEAGTGRLLNELAAAEHAAGMPGLFAEVRDRRRSWDVAAGVADVDTGQPVRAHFRHRVGSITKTFVATTVLQLVGERRLRLDAPVGRYLPGLLPHPLGRQVTVRMLLNHTSGIGNYTNALFADPEADLVAVGRRDYRPIELVRTGLALPPTNAPGAAWSYSNTNYVILGLLIERLTGRPYAVEVTRRILRPLGLRDTYFPGHERRIRGPHSEAYVPWLDGELRDFSVYSMTWAWAAGELVSTPSDLNRFYRALLHGRLLPARLLAEMQTTVPIDPATPDAAGYGLGLYWMQLPCGRFWGHDGGTIGHVTISLHSTDGRRQATLAENMAFYQVPGEAHPIDVARAELLVTALCGPQQAATRAAAPTVGPLTPDVTLR